MNTFWAGRRHWWREVRKGGSRPTALCTVLALLALLAVSGPHLVHHLLEQPLQHDDPDSPDSQAPAGPDCQVLFLIQHTPVAAPALAFVALLSIVILLASTLSIWFSTDCRRSFHARAPPV